MTQPLEVSKAKEFLRFSERVSDYNSAKTYLRRVLAEFDALEKKYEALERLSVIIDGMSVNLEPDDGEDD